MIFAKNKYIFKSNTESKEPQNAVTINEEDRRIHLVNFTSYKFTLIYCVLSGNKASFSINNDTSPTQLFPRASCPVRQTK